MLDSSMLNVYYKNACRITLFCLPDTARAISLLEDYCSKLKKPEEQQLKTAILSVMGIFKSSLFQALIGKLMYSFCKKNSL